MRVTGSRAVRIDRGARLWTLAGWAAAALLAAGCSGTAPPPPSVPAARSSSASRPVSIEPAAREVIDRLAKVIGASRSFAVRLVNTTTVSDDVAAKLAGVLEQAVRVERPNRLAVVLSTDRPGSGSVISDGQTLVIHQKSNDAKRNEPPRDANRYETSSAPATLPELIDNPHLRTMLSAGGADVVTKALLADDPAAAILEGVQELSIAGDEDIDGRPCTHLVARSESGNWDLWVAIGDEAVPVKFVPAIGQLFLGGKYIDLSSTVTFDQWRLDPVFEAADFAFVPGEGEGWEKVESLAGSANQGRRERSAARPSLHPTVGFSGTPLSLVGMDGSRFNTSMQKDKIVVLDFWATWCGPCRVSLPVVVRVCKEYADKGVVFRAVNLKEDAETIRRFLQDEPIDAPVVMDTDGTAAAAYRVEAIPHTVVVGRNGVIEAVHVGASEGLEADLRKQLDALLEGKSLAPKVIGPPRAEPL